MTEDQHFHDAYDRLGSSLAPPPDAAARVEGRMASRRRRRRAGIAGAAALVLAAGVGGVAVLGSGDGPDAMPVATDDPTPPPPAFTFTRPDGSTYAFDAADLTLECERGRVRLTSPQAFDETAEQLTEPFFYVEAKADAVADQTITLPFSGFENRGSDQRELIVFVADAGPDANEVSSDEGGAAGTVTIGRASCDPTPVLEVQVDATLGSEVQQGTFEVKGSFS